MTTAAGTSPEFGFSRSPRQSWKTTVPGLRVRLKPRRSTARA